MAIWRILRGVHADNSARLVQAVKPKEKPGAFLRNTDGSLATVDDKKDGEPIYSRIRNSGENIMFYPGDIVETDKNLNSLQVGNAKRYELLPHYDTSQTDKDNSVTNLDSLTIPQLREMAENEEIDLGDASKKSEIIEMIRLQSQTETAGV